MSSNLEDKVKKAAAKLWGKPVSQVHFEIDREDCTAGVFAFEDEAHPGAGTMRREVIVYPDPDVDLALSQEYYIELLQSLLDVIEGAIRRKTVGLSLASRSLN